MTTTVGPRTIAVNAAAWLIRNGWDAARHHADNGIYSGAAYTFHHGWGENRQVIVVDNCGIDHTRGHHPLTPLVDTGGCRPKWADMARAVNRLVADGVLPVELSTGWQAGAEEIKRLKQRVHVLEQTLVAGDAIVTSLRAVA